MVKRSFALFVSLVVQSFEAVVFADADFVAVVECFFVVECFVVVPVAVAVAALSVFLPPVSLLLVAYVLHRPFFSYAFRVHVALLQVAVRSVFVAPDLFAVVPTACYIPLAPFCPIPRNVVQGRQQPY